MQIMKRTDVTEMVVMSKIKKGLSWTKIAKAVGESKEWTTAALLGQMQMTKKQATAAGKLLGLPPDAVLLLQQVPSKGSLPTAVPTDPLIYRFYELVSVYGTTFKELIHEEFGDGIMSAIDFKMDLKREADPKGDRVNIHERQVSAVQDLLAAECGRRCAASALRVGTNGLAAVQRAICFGCGIARPLCYRFRSDDHRF